MVRSAAGSRGANAAPRMFFALRKFGVLRERAHRRSKWFSAARTGNAAIIEALIEEGQDIDVQGPYGRTALHYACLNGHRAMAQSLLERGANPSIEEYVDYYRPLHLAVYHGYVDIVNCLLYTSPSPRDQRGSRMPSSA